MEILSADFVIHSMEKLLNVWERYSNMTNPTNAKPQSRRRVRLRIQKKGKNKGKPSGGGGKHRAATSEVIRNWRKYDLNLERTRTGHLTKDSWKQVHSKVASLLTCPTFRAAAAAQGKAGTTSYKAGRAAFGKRPPKRKMNSTTTQPQPHDHTLTSMMSVVHYNLEDSIMKQMQHDERAVTRRKAEAEESVRAYSEKAIEQGLGQPSPYAKESASAFGAVCSPSVPNPRAHMELIMFPPPGIELLKKTIKLDRPGIQQKLLAAWSEKHKPLLHEKATPINTPKVTRNRCFEAGFCMCTGEPTPATHNFTHTLASLVGKTLRANLRKSSPAHKHYTKNKCYMHLQQFTQEVMQQSRYFHIGWGDNTKGLYCLMPMHRHRKTEEAISAKDFDIIVLGHTEGERPQDMYRMVDLAVASADVPEECHWHLEILREHDGPKSRQHVPGSSLVNTCIYP